MRENLYPRVRDKLEEMKMRSDKLSGCAFHHRLFVLRPFFKTLFYRVFGTGRRTFIPARTESSVKSCKNKSGVNQWYPTAAQMECTKGNWRKIKKPRLRALLRAYFNKIASVMQQTICWCPSLLFCRYVCHPRVSRQGGGFCCFILLLPRWLAKKTLLLCQQCNLLQIKDCSCHIYYPTFLWWRDTRPRHPLYIAENYPLAHT